LAITGSCSPWIPHTTVPHPPLHPCSSPNTLWILPPLNSASSAPSSEVPYLSPQLSLMLDPNAQLSAKSYKTSPVRNNRSCF
ncbi:unnamed protein product, partial [Gulo gulo]